MNGAVEGGQVERRVARAVSSDQASGLHQRAGRSRAAILDGKLCDDLSVFGDASVQLERRVCGKGECHVSGCGHEIVAAAAREFSFQLQLTANRRRFDARLRDLLKKDVAARRLDLEKVVPI